MRRWITPILSLALILTACASAPVPQPAPASSAFPPTATDNPSTEVSQVTSPVQDAPLPGAESMPVAFVLTSPAFAPESAIPGRYSCDGEDIPPQLAWTAPPAGTQSLALIMDDPDAPLGTWVHWVLYNIPAESTSLAESLPDTFAIQGKNSWQRLGYGGPCPPDGTHRYFFKLYAIDTSLDLSAGATKSDLLAAMDGHILAQATLTGTFTR